MQLVDIIEFVLVGVLGFMPLAIIHWTNRHSGPRTQRRRWAQGRRRAPKIRLLVTFTDWTSSIVL